MPAASRAWILPAMSASLPLGITTSWAAAVTYRAPSRTEPGMVSAAKSTGRAYARGDAVVGRAELGEKIAALVIYDFFLAVAGAFRSAEALSAIL